MWNIIKKNSVQQFKNAIADQQSTFPFIIIELFQIEDELGHA